jgi:protein-S-isoprenylcysteine O-methyltransferase Ste14
MRLFEVFPFLSFLALVFMILIKMIVLKTKGVKTSVKSSKQPFKKYLLYPVFIVAILSITFELLKPALQISLAILPPSITNSLLQKIYLQLTGATLLCFSLIIMGFTLVNFKNSLRFGMSKNNLGKLISTGIFSYSRNPFFLALDIYFIGISFIYINLYFIVISLLTIVSIHLFIQKEELFLMGNYGDEYKDYKQKVRRYF